MAENLIIAPGTDKAKRYETLIPQIAALTTGEDDLIANLSNIAAALKETFQFFWAGFYLVKEDVLVLGPFQGPIACTRIAKGKGVCGTAWAKRQVMIIEDVDKFPGHIACNSLSQSEIVLPIFKNNEVALVLDIDSDQLKAFDKVDEKYLLQITKIIEQLL